MVVNGHREHLLGVILTDHKIIERALDVRRLDETKGGFCLGRRLLYLPVYNCLTYIDTGVANVHARPRDDLLHLCLRFPAEGAERHAG